MTADSLVKFRLRVYYRKVGRGAWLSHLEVIRAIEAMIRRSNLNYCVSQGFSPHMKISFCQALSVGIESKNQTFDIYLKDYISPDKALKLMKDNCTCELEVFQCEYVDNNEVALSSIYGDVNYSAILDRKIEKIAVPDEICLVKKKKEKKINTKDYLVGDIDISYDKHFTILNFCLKTKSEGSLKPDLFLTETLKFSSCSEAKIIQFKKL